MMKRLKKEQLLIGILVGILLLVIAIPVPGEKKEETKEIESVETIVQTEQPGTEKQLQEILQKISGVGRVEVLLTYEDRGRLVVEKDESASEEQILEADSSGGTRTTTTARNERKTVYTEDVPYIVQELSPTVKGVLVVAEGAGNISVKKQIEETIVALFGLETHKISIMKMEVSK